MQYFSFSFKSISILAFTVVIQLVMSACVSLSEMNFKKMPGRLKSDYVRAGFELQDGNILLIRDLPAYQLGHNNCLAEIYNPRTGQSNRIDLHTKIENGNISFKGISLVNPTDPKLGFFIAEKWGLNKGRYSHQTLLLPGKKILLLGGWIESEERGVQKKISTSCDLYDGQTGRLELTCSMNIPRHTFHAVLLPSGKVLITGGETAFLSKRQESLRSVEILDIKSKSCTLIHSLRLPRTQHASVVLNDNTILIVGGRDFDRKNIDTGSDKAEIYCLDAKVRMPVLTMLYARTFPCAVRLKNGDILVLSGENHWKHGIITPMETNPDPLYSCERFTCSTMENRATSSNPI